MKFHICIKQVPDITAPISIRNGELVFETDRVVLDAYSASAVEESLVLTEKHGGETSIISIGPDKVKETIRKALAMGAEKATHIKTDENASLDSSVFARLLAAYFEKNPDYEVILLGKQAQDTDAGLTGSMLAEKMNLSYATNAVGLEYDESANKMIVTRQGDAGQEVIALQIPCLITCSNDMNDPRIPNLRGIMQSKKKPVEEISPDDLGYPSDKLQQLASTEITGYEPMPERQPGKKLEGEPVELAKQLVDLLQNEAKVL
ncbi:MAG TPA: electron transfer flavoprotein subunit beta/FixA family protein [Balneolales bacterium]|nr:electron transfer flavoprotein subunit beta/FixA family protein [Balneolales bacterium]